MTTASSDRRERLGQVIDLARIYRGWSRVEMASALNRDPAKIIPESGNPKLDLVIALADALEWSVGDVADSLWGDAPVSEGLDLGLDGPLAEDADLGSLEFEALNEQSLAAHRAGEGRRMLAIATTMQLVARTPRERALTAMRAAGAFDLLGRYHKALECLERASVAPDLPPKALGLLQANLANAHYTLWHLVEAKALAAEVVAKFHDTAPADRVERAQFAFALYVRGHASRRLMATNPDERRFHAAAARTDLERAGAVFGGMWVEYSDESYRGVENTCRGGLMEADVELGLMSAEDAVMKYLEGLDSVIDVDAHPRGDQLESWGWWSIFGANVALRHFGATALHRFVAIFSNKALEIADRLDNWSLRERAFGSGSG